jgi:hypothetical protein
VDGWPIGAGEDGEGAPTGLWEAADSKLSSVPAFGGVTHWIEFPEPVWNYERRAAPVAAASDLESGEG